MSARTRGRPRTPARGSGAACGSSAVRGDRGRADTLARGFPPVVDGRARVLVLGSLPGQASLAAREYYAQPQNAFWRIMGALIGAGPELRYRERLERLKQSSLALWDVLAAGERPGSLDSAIVRSSAVVNDFGKLLERHRGIGLICFNGRTAHDLYVRRVLPELPGPLKTTALQVLPSTSPAHAGMPFAAKLERWSILLEHLRGADEAARAGRP